jgi:Putative peptidoglycan binding domain
MKLFFVLICCLAIPLVARAADQGNNKKQKQTTQSHQQQKPQQRQQTATQSKHFSASTVSRQKLNNSSQFNSQSQNHALNTRNSNARVVQSNTQAKVASKHFALSNSPNPKIASTTFNRNYRIQGSQNWQGKRYGAFQNYRGQWHNQSWWLGHYNRIVLIGGGWYFWNAGYWYPAWGYDSAVAYYPYNGPIYAYNNLPPDQVIANVQSTLQAQGYYQGEIDGTLGPTTRAALDNYQQAHGLYRTEAIDEPTLQSLGMS